MVKKTNLLLPLLNETPIDKMKLAILLAIGLTGVCTAAPAHKENEAVKQQYDPLCDVFPPWDRPEWLRGKCGPGPFHKEEAVKQQYDPLCDVFPPWDRPEWLRGKCGLFLDHFTRRLQRNSNTTLHGHVTPSHQRIVLKGCVDFVSNITLLFLDQATLELRK